MANEFKVKKGLIVDGSGTVVDIQGTQGQLFSVTDSLTGDLFSVSDVSGIPIFNVNSSGIITIDGSLKLGDNDKIQIGDAQDLEIYHDGSNSYIKDNGTGNLYFNANGSDRFFVGSDVGVLAGTDFFIAQGRKLLLDGAGGHTYIEEESDSNLKFYVAGSERLNLSNTVATFAGRVSIGASINGNNTSGGNLVIDSSTAFKQLSFTSDVSGESEGVSGLVFIDNTSANSNDLYIGGGLDENNAMSKIVFKTASNNTTRNGTTRLTIDNTGEVKIGKSIHLGSDSSVLTPGQYSMLIEAPSGSGTDINMYTHNSSVFNINSNGTEAKIGWSSSQTREVNLVNTGNGIIKVGVGTEAPSNTLHVDSSTAFSLTSVTGDTLFLSDITSASSVGNAGGSIGFSGPQAIQRQAAIAALRTGDDHDHIGLAFYTHPGSGNDETIVKQLELTHDGTAIFAGGATFAEPITVTGNQTILLGGLYTKFGVYTDGGTYTNQWQKVLSIPYSSNMFGFSGFTLDIHQVGSTDGKGAHATIYFNMKFQSNNGRVNANVINYNETKIDASHIAIRRDHSNLRIELYHKVTTSYTRPYYFIYNNSASPTWYNTVTGDDTALAATTDNGFTELNLKNGFWSNPKDASVGFYGDVEIHNEGNDTTGKLTISGNNNTGTPGQKTSGTIEHRGEHLKTVITHNGSDVITIGTGTQTVFAGNISAQDLLLPDGADVAWDGGYTSSKPVLAANGTTMKMYPSGVTSGAQFQLTPTTATFAGNITANDGISVNNAASDKKISFDRTGGKGISIEHDTGAMYFYNETDSNVMFRMSNDGRIQAGIKTSSDSSIISQNSDIQLRIGSTGYEVSPYIRLQGKRDDGDGTYTAVYGDIKLDTVNKKLVFNDPGTSSGNIGTNPMTLDDVGNLVVNGNISLSGDVILATNAYAKKIYRSTATISSSSYTTVATVAGDNLGSAIRMVVTGTSGNVVMTNVAEILVNHSTDILIKTTNSFYRRLYIKIVSDGNEDFAIELKRDGDTNNTTIQIEIEPLGNETVTFTNTHGHTASTLEHVSQFGETTSQNDTAGNKYHKNMLNNQKLKFGDTGQLDLYHNGSNAFIENDTGDLTIDNQGDDLILKAADDALLYVQGSDIAIQAIGNGKVGLRYNNVEKLETTSDGVSIAGNTIIDGTPLNTGETVFDIQGDDGQLFSVTNSLTGDLFSVSDVSGIPIFNVNSSGAVDVDGTFTSSGDVVAYSDERLKTDVQTLDGSKVYNMRGVSFTKDNKKGSGVIAQELEKIAPELVNNNSQFKAVAYGNITGYLIEAIKDLKQEIIELKKQINNG